VKEQSMREAEQARFREQDITWSKRQNVLTVRGEALTLLDYLFPQGYRLFLSLAPGGKLRFFDAGDLPQPLPPGASDLS
jgi:hypothetical protein